MTGDGIEVDTQTSIGSKNQVREALSKNYFSLINYFLFAPDMQDDTTKAVYDRIHRLLANASFTDTSDEQRKLDGRATYDNANTISYDNQDIIINYEHASYYMADIKNRLDVIAAMEPEDKTKSIEMLIDALADAENRVLHTPEPYEDALDELLKDTNFQDDQKELDYIGGKMIFNVLHLVKERYLNSIEVPPPEDYQFSLT